MFSVPLAPAASPSDAATPESGSEGARLSTAAVSLASSPMMIPRPASSVVELRTV
jgi:hypothetical protein